MYCATRILGVLVLMLVLATMTLAQPYDHLEFWKSTRYGFNSAPNTALSNFKDVTLDAQGNVYVVGYGYSAETTTGSYQPNRVGGCNVFVAKFNSTLTSLIWGTYVGGNGDQIASSIALCSNGDVVICGSTTSTDFPLSSNSDRQYLDGSPVNFVARFSSDGSRLVFSRAYSYHYATAPFYTEEESSITGGMHGTGTVVVNSSDETIVLSSTSHNFITTSNAYQPAFAGNVDLCLSKFSSTGNVLYSTYIGGTGHDNSRSMCYVNGKMYLSARTSSANFPLATNKTIDASDCVVMLWNDGTVPSPSTSYVVGGSAADDCNRVVFNSATNKVNIVGTTNSTDFPQTGTLLRGEYIGGFLASLLPDLSASNYVCMLGANVKPYALRSRMTGDVVVSSGMQTAGGSVPLSPNAIRSVTTSYDMVISVVSADGSALRYGSYFGGSGVEAGMSVNLIDVNPCIYRLVLATRFSSSKTDFPMSSGAFKDNSCDCYTPALALVRTVHPDTFKVTPGQKCGEYFFEGTSSAFSSCELSSIAWNFDDTLIYVLGSSATSHTFPRNGNYNVKMKIVYGNGNDSVIYEKAVSVQSYANIVAPIRSFYRCANDSGVILRVNGGVRYEWRPGTGLSDSNAASPRARPTKNTFYKVRGYNAAGCFADDSLQVYVTSAVASVDKDTVICSGSSVVLHASGGGSFAWSPAKGLNTTKSGTVIASPQEETIYKVVVSDGNCSDSAKVKVSISHPARLRLSPAAIVCTGGTAQLSAFVSSSLDLDTVGMSYQWSPSSTLTRANSSTPVAQPLNTTRYTCRARNKYGCMSIDSVEVKVQSSLDLRLTGDSLVCVGNSTLLQARGGASYSWSPSEGLSDTTSATPLCTPTKNMTYTVRTWSGDYNTATCRDTSEITVNVVASSPVVATGDTSVCAQSTVTLGVLNESKEMSYEWTDINGKVLTQTAQCVVSPDSSQFYVVRQRTKLGCLSFDTVRVQVQTTLAVKIIGATSVQAGSTLRLWLSSTRSGQKVEWRNEKGDLLGTTDTLQYLIREKTTFYVLAKLGGCEGADSLVVNVTQYALVQACNDTTVCSGNDVLLYVQNAQDKTDYEWRDEKGAIVSKDSTVVLRLATEARYIIAANNFGVISYDTVLVHIRPTLNVQTHDTTVCVDHRAFLRASCSSATAQYQWFDANGALVGTSAETSVIARQSSMYTVVVRDSLFCESRASMILSTEKPVAIFVSAGTIGTSHVMQNVSIPIYAKSDRIVPPVTLQFSLHVDKTFLQLANGTTDASDNIFNYNKAVQLDTINRVIAVLDGWVLASPQEQASIRILDLASSLDSSCSRVQADGSSIRVATVCNSRMYNFSLIAAEFSLAPNPNRGSFEILCSGSVEEIQVLNALGATCSYEMVGRTLMLSNAAEGLYFVRLRIDDRYGIKPVLVAY